jgi:uncharacterized protein YjiK
MSNKKDSGMREGVTIVVASALVFFGILFWGDISGMFTGEEKEKTKGKVKKEKKGKDVSDVQQDPGIKILDRWDLPSELKEVSGISYLPDSKFACVQDEKGTVYIYDTKTEKIEKEIPFSGVGDFEGITAADQTLYVIRADGRLFMIENMNTAKPAVKEFETGLTIRNNIESMCFDKNGDRLLLTGKDEDPEGADKKRIYSFDLKSKKLDNSPAYTIDLNDELLQDVKKGLQPSALGVHPVSSNIYIVDGPAGKLLILDPRGAVMNIYSLDSKDLPQAEGISFGVNGNIYISTEGAKGAGAIVEVSIP